MRFSEIIGQEDIKKKLIQTVKENRISHAQLFFGPEGNGKLALAIAYAQYLNCHDKQENDSCGKCSSCLKFSKLIHPDLHFSFPVFKKSAPKETLSDDFLPEWRELLSSGFYINQKIWYEKIGMENKQGGILTDESQSIIRKLNLKAFESDYKTLIMWLPEKMNLQASNKLLKMIEEPPKNTLILLVSEDTGNIISTILSRTQLIKIPAISREDLAEGLAKQFEEPREKLNEIAHLSRGNYLEAAELLSSSKERGQFREWFIRWMRMNFNLDIGLLLPWIDELAKAGREKQKRFLSYAGRMIRNNFLLQIKEKDLALLGSEEMEFSSKFHNFIRPENIRLLYEEINKAITHIEMNGNARIIFMDLSLIIARSLRTLK